MTTQSGGLVDLGGRIKRRYRLGGWRALAAAAGRRYGRWTETTPVFWARFGPASLSVAKLVKPLQPPVLVLSLGRSGSTWVAQMLGEAADALWLDEPINRGLIAQDVAYHSQVEKVPAEPPEVYQRHAHLAFAACPAFAYPTLRLPEQWSLAHRGQRRLVVKEVNPLGCDWLLRRYRPRVILLVRHPAAVVLSFQKMDWWIPRADYWYVHAFRQARALRAALDSVTDYPDCRILLYEDLCAQPLEHFRNLFDFAGLQWDARIETLVRARSASGDTQDPWGTSRQSRSMIGAWRGQLTDEQLRGVRTGFSAFDLPWYRSSDDW